MEQFSPLQNFSLLDPIKFCRQTFPERQDLYFLASRILKVIKFNELLAGWRKL